MKWCREVGSASCLVNSLEAIEWNIDKRYLLQLQSCGVPTIQTAVVEAGDECRVATLFQALGCKSIVAKPTIGAGGSGLEVIAHDQVGECGTLDYNRTWDYDVLLQPLIPSIRTDGEWSLVFVADEFRHAVRKRPAFGDIRSQPEYGSLVTLESPPHKVLDAARLAIARGPKASYARIDILLDGDAALVIEAEYIEPQLFFSDRVETAMALAQTLSASHQEINN
ncbi:ATP-grasp domain-containing protein [Botrimarina hoheduenensis]|uniref:ATP-grasp domain-containing protein n=1 Tax=Botrimarina hoheduenensis TaxID=2528000 RepID=UPI0011B766AD|nr:hypothetical protein [Botrimarina hoheduenensis]